MIDSKTILDGLHWRYATKQFDPERKVSDADLKTLLEAMRLAPSSFGLQPWKFMVIGDRALKASLVAESWNQAQVNDCSHLIVIAARRTIDERFVDRFVDHIAGVRKVDRQTLSGYRGVMVDFVKKSAHELPSWATRQCYIPLATLIQTAAMLGIDTCPMEGIDPIGYDRLLGLGADYFTVVVCPVGYRSAGDKYAALPKVRYGADEVIEYR